MKRVARSGRQGLLVIGLAAASLAISSGAHAGVVGTIVGCYDANNCGFVGNIDGPSFEFNNTSSQAITNGTFTIFANGTTGQDTFNVGTIAANSSVVVTPA